MGRSAVIAGVVAASLAAAPAASATTQSAHSGNVSATFTFTGLTFKTKHQHLTIVRAGKTVYSARVTSKFCGTMCGALAIGKHSSSVHVVDLEHTGEPDVVLDLFSGGAHCCAIEQFFTYNAATRTYVKTERNFGDPGIQIVDLGHNGHHELLTADDRFAYEFTDFAASGLPIQILTFSHRHFQNVTRSYPKLIAKDAALWLKSFKGEAKRLHYSDSTGVIAAWAADECLLGHAKSAFRYLDRQAKAGHLNSALSPEEPSGAKFVTRLRKFLRKHGYVH
jgi:hypothetical protein